MKLKYEKNNNGLYEFNFYDNEKIIYSAIPILAKRDFDYLKESNLKSPSALALQLELTKNLLSYNINADIKDKISYIMRKLSIEDFKEIVDSKAA